MQLGHWRFGGHWGEGGAYSPFRWFIAAIAM